MTSEESTDPLHINLLKAIQFTASRNLQTWLTMDLAHVSQETDALHYVAYIARQVATS